MESFFQEIMNVVFACFVLCFFLIFSYYLYLKHEQKLFMNSRHRKTKTKTHHGKRKHHGYLRDLEKLLN